MMRLILVCVLTIVAIANIKASRVCHVKNGKTIVAFSGTREQMRFPCKYDAIRNTTCGNWKITVSPGNMLESNRNKQYVIKTMWVKAERLSDGKFWQGRTSLKIARKYLKGIQSEPYNTKGGSLSISDVFDFSNPNLVDEVELIQKNGDFKISFGLFNPSKRWHRSSTFKFQCFHSDFVPSPYPDQLCGNGTRGEVKKFRQMNKWKGNRVASIYYNIFGDRSVIQTDENCIGIQDAMNDNCVYNGENLTYNASKLCWPLVGQGKYQRCISGNMDDPGRAFKHCVEFVCSGFQSTKACEGLAAELDMCPRLPTVSDAAANKCLPSLYTTEEDEDDK